MLHEELQRVRDQFKERGFITVTEIGIILRELRIRFEEDDAKARRDIKLPKVAKAPRWKDLRGDQPDLVVVDEWREDAKRGKHP